MAVSDVELEAEALAAGPVDEVADDAVCWWDVVPRERSDLLPEWYMPTAAAGASALRGGRRALAWLLIATFLSINAAGFCFTYGAIT